MQASSDALPRFFVIGAPKSATTTVCYHLARHPEVCFSQPKEPHFFSNDKTFARGLEWYQTCFHLEPGHRVIGEGSMSYTICAVYPHTVQRLKESYPDAKFVYIVRHPIDRIRSHAMQAWSDGAAPSSWSLERVLRAVPAVVDPSRYWTQLSCWLEAFDEEEFHIEFYESVASDLRGVLERICSFVGVDPEKVPSALSEARNVSSDKRALSPTVYRASRIAKSLGLRWKLMPRQTKRWMSSVPGLMRKYPSADLWASSELPRLIDEIRPEAERFLEFAEKPLEYWSWETAS